jgi:hypothetical protein
METDDRSLHIACKQADGGIPELDHDAAALSVGKPSLYVGLHFVNSGLNGDAGLIVL